MVDNLKYIKQAKELVSKMTIEEQAGQLSYEAAAIEHLNIPSYNWWNEGLHGIARSGIATVFPQSIGLAATFDKEILQKAGHITGYEARIKYNFSQKYNDHNIYKGLTIWAPNINIYRDPRWGRGHETYGEDPVLTMCCADNYVRGIQEGEDKEYLQASACLKHFAAHSGPEGIRHGFNSEVSEFDMNDTYLPAFKYCIEKSEVDSVMGAYNMINGVPACANKEIIGRMRDEWGFKGYVVSDCGALADMHMFCLYTHTAVESAAVALKAGCNLNCGNVYLHILEALKEGLVTEQDITVSCEYVMATRLKLGILGEHTVYDSYTDYSKLECKEHREEAYKAACESIVMLKNDGLLPLDKNKIKTVGVIGPNANSIRALEGNYNGTSSRYKTVLMGIQDECDKNDINVMYALGCPLYKDVIESCSVKGDGFSEAYSVAENSDAVVMVLGLDSSIEGEQGDASNEYGAGDKETLRFPGLQQELLENVVKMGKPVVLVVLAGGSLDLNYADEKVNAILYGWYPGSEGGKAVADIIFGNQAPSGKCPVTFYKSLDDIPGFSDYNMQGRTYRYLTKTPLYPFGYGLTYGKVELENVTTLKEENGHKLTVTVKNSTDRPVNEVIEVYAQYKNEKYIMPNSKLCGFERVSLKSGEEKQITVYVDNEWLLLTDKYGNRYYPENEVTLNVGVSGPDNRSIELCGVNPLQVKI